MERIPEPELMDETQQAAAYAGADFEEPNQRFVETFLERFGLPRGTMLDLGCGPADIPLRFARSCPQLHITAVDGAPAMIELAQHALDRERGTCRERIHLVCATLQTLELPPAAYDAVISNSLLHHLHDPAPFWQCIRQHARPGAAVLVMDLARPASRTEAESIVDTYAATEPPVLRRDFFNSLLAAFTPQEVTDQLAAAALLPSLQVERTSDRHWIAHGRIA
ncbi:hypothetical protein CKO15_04580 [Halorhodospira abdelmalekii]|uniref:class I SAM-dependent methyltransferase n=1 Tax=Halorhodospira abdelmalekii TaxID=421629 RepID=UPI00190843DD|nr:class I SAM-dependent methyltransferase [Halorhodospira abdelmalekii]MBK1734572.1 hypothetical protein [Halorhodospira abdelmalekii]